MALSIAFQLPAAGSHKPMPKVAMADLGPKIYQPYFSAAQRDRLHPLAAPLDGSFNTGPSTREYELFRAVQKRHESEAFPADRFWGVVSASFESKSPIPFATFIAEARQAEADGYDCYLCNPMIGNAAIYASVWEQALAGGHPGMEPVFGFLNDTGYPVSAVQGAHTFAFCNYVCGNKKFWNGYFNFLEDALARLEDEAVRGTPAGICYAGGSGYRRGGDVAMRVFVIERLLGCYLQLASQSGVFAVASHCATAADFELKFGPRLASVLYPLYRTKNDAVEASDLDQLRLWFEARSAIASGNPRIVWELDDPPAWIPNPHAVAI